MQTIKYARLCCYGGWSEDYLLPTKWLFFFFFLYHTLKIRVFPMHEAKWKTTNPKWDWAASSHGDTILALIMFSIIILYKVLELVALIFALAQYSMRGLVFGSFCHFAQDFGLYHLLVGAMFGAVCLIFTVHVNIYWHADIILHFW